MMNTLPYCRLGILLMAFFVASCTSNPPEVFDLSKSKLLTPEEKEEMDVEFFNVFVTKSMSIEQWKSDKGSPRGDVVHALAEEGFEVAWLAEKFFDFYHLGYKKVTNGEVYWNRLKTLADAGDASAQCFFALSVTDLNKYGYFKPPKEDLERREVYLQKAVGQKQSECFAMAGKRYQEGNGLENHFRNNLYAARKGCASCQNRVALHFSDGRGVKKDFSKALCWARKATIYSDSPQYVNTYKLIQRLAIHEHIDPQSIQTFNPNGKCN